MRLVIAEKPSVARDLARILGANQRKKTYYEGGGLRITWCFGHMCELVDPVHYNPAWKRWALEQLPMIPENFALRYKKDQGEHWREVKKLLTSKDVTEVVNACDAGREGELIFRFVYQLSKCSHPILRLWVSSLTEAAIKAGWNSLRSGNQYNSLADAARCRAEADWLVGLNATRAMTCMVRKAGGDQLLTVGRVQTPTLALITKRDFEIENFVPQTFWKIESHFSAKPQEEECTWKGTWFKKLPAKASKEEKENSVRRFSLAEANSICEAVQDQVATVTQAKNKRKEENPPLLYDLNSLQQRANVRFGFSAQQTLDIAQALYERHKILTYPRTDARYLTPDQASTIPKLLATLKTIPPYKPHIAVIEQKPLTKNKRIYNAAEVGDHHAIIPTGKSPLSVNLTIDEKRIFDLVARRFLAVFSPKAIFHLRDLVVSVPAKSDVEIPKDLKSPLLFQSKGKVRLEAGWQAVDPPAKHSDTNLPDIQKGLSCIVKDPKAIEGKTRPPNSYTEASLLGAMERAGKDLEDKELQRAMRNAGLGTPATRASIIENLIRRGYLQREKKSLRSTQRGRNLIEAIPISELKSAEMTGLWESRLSSMSEGKESRENFMQDIKSNLSTMILSIKDSAAPVPEQLIQNDNPSLGSCPICSTPIRKRGKVYRCANGQSCSFVIFETVAGRTLSNRMIKNLIEKGSTPKVKGFKSKRNKKTFEAGLKLNKEGRVVFDFNAASSTQNKAAPSKPVEPSAAPTSEPVTPVGLKCPQCKKGSLIRGRAAWGCNRYREGCRYVFPFSKAENEADAVQQILQSRGHSDS
ncbi:MAG: DNA topoisomerase 3 [Myxococcota bacterium]|nr:DNA topoisomerase 3 [Myxococcota bacterium]